MAESKGSKRYNHGPKIAEKGAKEMGTAHETTKPEKETKGAEPKGDVTSGTDDVKATAKEVEPVQKDKPEPGLHEVRNYEMPTHERHLKERKEMHARHKKELEEAHARHDEEHGKMNKRHEEEMGGEGKEKAA